jgi:hypothetical protein
MVCHRTQPFFRLDLKMMLKAATLVCIASLAASTLSRARSFVDIHDGPVTFTKANSPLKLSVTLFPKVSGPSTKPPLNPH